MTARELEQLEQRIRKEEQQKAKQIILEQTKGLAEQIVTMMLVIPTNVLVADYWQKSAKKRILVSERQNLRNRMIKSSVKTALRRVDAAVKGGNAEQIQAAYKTAISLVDKSVLKGIMHKHTAAHKKAQLAKLVGAK